MAHSLPFGRGRRPAGYPPVGLALRGGLRPHSGRLAQVAPSPGLKSVCRRPALHLAFVFALRATIALDLRPRPGPLPWHHESGSSHPKGGSKGLSAPLWKPPPGVPSLGTQQMDRRQRVSAVRPAYETRLRRRGAFDAGPKSQSRQFALLQTTTRCDKHVASCTHAHPVASAESVEVDAPVESFAARQADDHHSRIKPCALDREACPDNGIALSRAATSMPQAGYYTRPLP